jgi:phosphate transport system permease protein
LSALIYNITNDSAGYAAMKSKVNPYTLTDGRPLDELTHAELNQILIDNTSRNRYRTINNQRPIDERTREELVDLVLIEVVKPSVINTWTITDSFFKKSVIEKEFAQIQEKNPDAYMEYRVWINWEFITSPQKQRSYAGWYSYRNYGFFVDYIDHDVCCSSYWCWCGNLS